MVLLILVFLHLFVKVEFVNFGQDPAHTAIAATHEDPEVVKLLK